MRRVREGVSAGEVRHCDVNPCSATRGPVNFLHYLNDVLEVLDNVINVDALEAGVRKRPGRLVQIVNYVRLCLPGAVHVNSIFYSLSSAAQIQHVGITGGEPDHLNVPFGHYAA